ncbi:YtrH family sporulation protein [Alicyclobacillus herbarius]|uniref:YtrH family sporulation protein n=1 Tax=Alicyclobacillus herbarius TaxID=122960 RepID=UPI00040F88E7|nr:YtrH family sporulation protein [Alicyclobacillus herbarius]
MNGFLGNLFAYFFIAMGMVLGGSLLGGVAAAIIHWPAPMGYMLQLADRLKIWAMVSTLGGTMDTLRAIETGVLHANLNVLGKQFTYLTAAFIGCQVGYWLIETLYAAQGSELPK